MTGNFRDWLRQEFAAREAAFGRLASASIMVVAVSRHAWRGHRLMKDVTIAHNGAEVKKTATTHPRWSLVPDSVKATFDLLDNGVESLLAQFCVGRRKSKAAEADDEVADGTGFILRRGVYAVDAAHFPALKDRMRIARTKWDEAADRLCSEEGYRHLHELVKEKVGPEHYEDCERLVPPRGALRAKYGLQFYRLPIRLDPDPAADADEREGAAEALLELLETGVREPREDLARTVAAFAAQLVIEQTDGTVLPFRPTLVRDGQTVARGRTLTEKSVLAVHRALDEFGHKARFADAPLREAIQALRELVPDSAGAAAAAAKWRSDDAAAVATGTRAYRVVTLALDESSMCTAVAAALKAL